MLSSVEKIILLIFSPPHYEVVKIGFTLCIVFLKVLRTLYAQYPLSPGYFFTGSKKQEESKDKSYCQEPGFPFSEKRKKSPEANSACEQQSYYGEPFHKTVFAYIPVVLRPEEIKEYKPCGQDKGNKKKKTFFSNREFCFGHVYR